MCLTFPHSDKEEDLQRVLQTVRDEAEAQMRADREELKRQAEAMAKAYCFALHDDPVGRVSFEPRFGAYQSLAQQIKPWSSFPWALEFGNSRINLVRRHLLN